VMLYFYYGLIVFYYGLIVFYYGLIVFLKWRHWYKNVTIKYLKSDYK
jgi:hypothetical protein